MPHCACNVESFCLCGWLSSRMGVVYKPILSADQDVSDGEPLGSGRVCPSVPAVHHVSQHQSPWPWRDRSSSRCRARHAVLQSVIRPGRPWWWLTSLFPSTAQHISARNPLIFPTKFCHWPGLRMREKPKLSTEPSPKRAFSLLKHSATEKPAPAI